MATYKLESVQWRRPGIKEVEISALVGVNQMPRMPNPKDFLEGFTGQMIERRVQRLGIAEKVTWKYRMGEKLPDQASEEFWTMDVALMQVPITTHPNLQQIMAAGGGVLKNNDVDWPRYLNGRKNPWYGVISFLFPTITVTKEKVRAGIVSVGGLSFPQVDGVGYSEDSLDAGGFRVNGSPGPGRKRWLLESHTLSKVGHELRERKVWRHGGVIGWADQIYDKNWRAKTA